MSDRSSGPSQSDDRPWNLDPTKWLLPGEMVISRSQLTDVTEKLIAESAEDVKHGRKTIKEHEADVTRWLAQGDQT